VNFSIETGWPPNIEAIRAVLPVSERNIFAYGNVIFNPGGCALPGELIVHEQVHFEQQRKMASWWRRNGAEVWWRKFLASPEFRLDQELEAHRAEYREYCRIHRDRNDRQRALRVISGRLAKPMYGGIISQREARRAIQ
jgi:hypothetical protein